METVLDRKGRPHTRLCWNYRLENHVLELGGEAVSLERARDIKVAISSADPYEALSATLDKATLTKVWPILRRGGLVRID